MVNKMIMLIARKINSLNQSSLTFSFSLLIKFVFLKKTEIFTCSKYLYFFPWMNSFTQEERKRSQQRELIIWIIFPYPSFKTCLEYLWESPQKTNSNKYPHYVFHWRNRENYSVTCPYLEMWKNHYSKGQLCIHLKKDRTNH